MATEPEATDDTPGQRRRAVAVPVDIDAHQRHPLHEGERDWAETNCYADVWIELLHVLGHDPVAGLGFTIGVDLEADQWTFFKFPHDELRALYGIDVIELNPWSTVLDQTVAELDAGRPVLIEVDAWHLPDTQGTTYRNGHVKTTIAVLGIDLDARWMHYAHNQSVHQLDGADLLGIFGLADDETSTLGPAWLPPYIEVAKQVGEALHRDAVGDTAMMLLRRHVAAAPASNPFIRWAKRFPADIDRMHRSGGALFHGWSFATFRQFGAAFSLAATHLDWLSDSGAAGSAGLDTAPSSAAFRSISATAKALQFRAARAALAGKPIDATSHLSSLADAWDEGIGDLRDRLGR